MPDCPDDTELAGFLNDDLAGDRLGQVGGHVDSCPTCQARLDRLTEHTSGAVARYKELSSVGLPDARSGAGADSAPEAETQVIGGKLPSASKLIGLPRVRGFEIGGEIGRGGMGVVYKARHLRLNRLVALKMILAGGAADPRGVQRFLFEAEFLAKIQHPQVVQVFEIDMYQGPNAVPIPYIAMELLEGGSLHRRLKQSAGLEPGDPPRWPTARGSAELIEGVARAVHAAHLRGVVHRDLKPGNILFSAEVGAAAPKPKDGTAVRAALRGQPPPPLAKVTDFGLAKFTQDAGADLTHSGQIVGTPAYMAPEQASGERQVTPAVDVYALGAILFECLAGRPPFVGSEPISVMMRVVSEAPPDVRSLRPDVPRDLAAVTMKCLEKDPARRYISAEALANDLRRFLDDRPTRARPVRAPERARLWVRRNPAVAGLLAALFAVVLTAFGVVAWLWVRAERKADDERRAKVQTDLARARAEHETENAAAALREAHQQKALLEFSRAVTSCEDGRVREGLAAFLLAARLAEETGEHDLARVARVNVAAWPRDLPPVPRAFPHKEQPRLAAFRPGTTQMVTVGREGDMYLWDAATGRKLHAYKPAPTIRASVTKVQQTFWTVAVSPNGKTVAAGGTDGSITLWDADKPDPAHSFDATGVIDEVWSVGFSADAVLWSNDGKNGVKRWDLTDPKHPQEKRGVPRPGPEPAVLQILAVSPDGGRVYTGDRGGVVREWDAAAVAQTRSWRVAGWVTDIAVSPDGTRVATTGTEGLVRVFDVSDRRLPVPPEVLALNLAGAYGNGVAFAPKRPFLLATDGDGNLRFWHRDTGQPIGIPMRFRGEVTRPRFRPNSDEFAVPAGDTVCVCGLPDPPGDVLSAGHNSRLRGLDFSPDGGRLAVADENTFELFDLHKGKLVQTVTRAGDNPLTIRFDPDPSRPVVYRGTRSGFDRLAVPNGRSTESALLSRVLTKVVRMECLPGPGRLYALGVKRVMRLDPIALVPITIGGPAKNLPPGAELSVMAVRPDGGEVLVSAAGRMMFLKGDTLAPLREWAVGDEVLDARYTPDGSKLLIGRRDNVAELLDAATGKPTSTRPMPHERAVTAVAVSNNGAVLLTGSRDGTARYWDAVTGLPLAAPMRHTGPVTHVAFSPNGDHIATGTGTGHITVWDLPPPPANGTVEELHARLTSK